MVLRQNQCRSFFQFYSGFFLHRHFYSIKCVLKESIGLVLSGFALKLRFFLPGFFFRSSPQIVQQMKILTVTFNFFNYCWPLLEKEQDQLNFSETKQDWITERDDLCRRDFMTRETEILTETWMFNSSHLIQEIGEWKNWLL